MTSAALTYPQVVSVTVMPNGERIEIVKVPYTATGTVYNYVLRNKATNNLLDKKHDTLHGALGAVYGRVKAQEMKILKEQVKSCSLCSNCQQMMEI